MINRKRKIESVLSPDAYYYVCDVHDREFEYDDPGEMCSWCYGATMERDRIMRILCEHGLTGQSVGGILAMCSCGTAVDDHRQHIIDIIYHEWDNPRED